VIVTVIIRRNDPTFDYDLFAEKPPPLPAAWTGPHVGLCITAGFTTLAKMPRRDRMGARSAWPSYMYEFEDLINQSQQGELERTMQQQNRVRIAPSATEIMNMEQSLYWPLQFLQAKPELCEAVNAVALAHSLGLDAGWVAKKRGGVADTWRTRFELGCERIARGLVRDQVRVF
jgi:hypothetical protein